MRSPSTAEPGLDSPLGRYRLIALLGQGGMADVYLACTQGAGGFQKLLVVKLARFTGDPVFSTMFLSEARLAAQLSHPNIVQTFEIGEEGTRHYIVMEYLDGGNFSRLRQKMVKQGGIPLRISLHILLHVLDGLEYAHEAVGLDGKELKVVHRDLSPSNILVTAQGVVKILDFGIAKASDSASFTQTGKFSGKLEYMPPEQLRGERVDARADIFSFGVMLAESFLGEKLWGGATGPKIAAELGAGKIPSLDRGVEIDPELRRIVEKALDPDREKRYATAAEIKADLAAYVATLGKPVTQKELADFVRKTVEDDRAKLQSVIDNQLQRISLLAWGGETPPPDLPRLEPTPSGAGATIQDEMVVEDSDKVSVITKERDGRPSAARPQRKSSALPLVLIGGGTLAAIAVIAWIAIGRGGGDTKTADTPPPAAPAPVATTVRLEIVASPSEATFALDGKPLGGNPYVGMVAKDAGAHELTVTAPGYQALTQQFALDRDASFHLSLTKVVAPVATVTEPAVTAPPTTAPPTAATIGTRATAPARSTSGSRKGSRRTPSAAPAPAITPPGTPAVTATVATPPGETKPADTKRSLDNGVYDTKPTKRSLDSNVLDSGSNKPKPSIDRDNPWKN